MTIDLSGYSAAQRRRIIVALSRDRELDVTTSWPIGHSLRGTDTIAVDIDKRASRGSLQDDARISAAIDAAVRS